MNVAGSEGKQMIETDYSVTSSKTISKQERGVSEPLEMRRRRKTGRYEG